MHLLHSPKGELFCYYKYMSRIISLKFLNLKSKSELETAFINLSKRKLRFNSHDLVIFPEDFNHCCYEYDEGGAYKAKLSLRRARRILQIEQICNNEIPYEIIYEHKHHKKTVVVISEIAEFCLVVLPVFSNEKKFWRLITIIAFGKKVESGISKILENGKVIKRNELNKLFTKENED